MKAVCHFPALLQEYCDSGPLALGAASLPKSAGKVHAAICAECLSSARCATLATELNVRALHARCHAGLEQIHLT
jgi:hypothetical protein